MSHPFHVAIRSLRTSLSLLEPQSERLPDDPQYRPKIVKGTWDALWRTLSLLRMELQKCRTVEGQPGQVFAGGEIRPLNPIGNVEDVVLGEERNDG